MARKKKYIEAEVIEKAMALFWRNGYTNTSMLMLEKEMGINKFSIYASFGSKNGVFLESIKCYKSKLSVIVNKLKRSKKGIEGIKQYFYDFVDFSKEANFCKGCLVTNTADELNQQADPAIKMELLEFTNQIRGLFAKVLAQETTKEESLIEEQADYLIISMVGLSSASKMFNKVQLKNYIEHVFKKL